MDLFIEHSDFPVRYVKLPEGICSIERKKVQGHNNISSLDLPNLIWMWPTHCRQVASVMKIQRSQVFIEGRCYQHVFLHKCSGSRSATLFDLQGRTSKHIKTMKKHIPKSHCRLYLFCVFVGVL